MQVRRPASGMQPIKQKDVVKEGAAQHNTSAQHTVHVEVRTETASQSTHHVQVLELDTPVLLHACHSSISYSL